MLPQPLYLLFFFFNDTATTEIYTLSLHDALPISNDPIDTTDFNPDMGSDMLINKIVNFANDSFNVRRIREMRSLREDRKSTRLNSSHQIISYAVFCLKKKKITSK